MPRIATYPPLRSTRWQRSLRSAAALERDVADNGCSPALKDSIRDRTVGEPKAEADRTLWQDTGRCRPRWLRQALRRPGLIWVKRGAKCAGVPRQLGGGSSSLFHSRRRGDGMQPHRPYRERPHTVAAACAPSWRRAISAHPRLRAAVSPPKAATLPRGTPKAVLTPARRGVLSGSAPASAAER